MGDGMAYQQPKIVGIVNELYNKAKAHLESGKEIELNVYKIMGAFGASYVTAKGAVETVITKLQDNVPNVECRYTRGKGYKLIIKQNDENTNNVQTCNEFTTHSKRGGVCCEICGVEFPSMEVAEHHKMNYHNKKEAESAPNSTEGP